MIKIEEIHALWQNGIISWMLWEQQLPIYKSIRDLDEKAALVVILCARQFGKTYLGTLLAIEDCLRFVEKSVLIVGPTIKQTKEIIAPKIRQISKTAPRGLIRQSKSEGKWYIGSCDLIIGGFDQRISSDRGKSLQTVYVEEIVDSHPDKYLESMRSDIGPTLTHAKNGKIIFLTTLPKIPDHPFITETITEAKLDGAFYSYDIDDNKALSPEQRERCIKLAGGVESVDYLREYKNQIIRDPGLVVLPSFTDKENVREIKLPPRSMFQTTIDFGGVRDKTAVSISCYIYHLNVVYFVDELIYDPNTSTDIIIGEVLELEKKWGIELINPQIDLAMSFLKAPMRNRIIDCAGQTRVDLLEKGFICAVPPKTNWRGNINNLDNKFRNGEALIHPRCKFLIESANSGTLNRTKTDFERTKSLGHCDGIANMMYAVRAMPIENPAGYREKTRHFNQMTNDGIDKQNESGIKNLANAFKR